LGVEHAGVQKELAWAREPSWAFATITNSSTHLALHVSTLVRLLIEEQQRLPGWIIPMGYPRVNSEYHSVFISVGDSSLRSHFASLKAANNHARTAV
jgi:hypothetical protein